MGRNYEALHHIQIQLSEYDKGLSHAIQRLFNILDQKEESQGCVIVNIISALIFKKYGIEPEIHLGEVITDGEHEAYHCWLTIEGKIFDMGIYGNSNFNPYYYGEKLKWPVILEENTSLQYKDGTNDPVVNNWFFRLSEMPVTQYIKECPKDMLRKWYLRAMDISETVENKEKIYELSKGMAFPEICSQIK